MELKTLRWEDDPGLSERAINIITFIFFFTRGGREILLQKNTV
jgi:hypothetical protein